GAASRAGKLCGPYRDAYPMIKIITRYSPVPVVFVSGRVAGDDAGYLKSTLLELADHGFDSVALELSEVSAIDSAGIGALLAARGRLVQVGGSLCLVNGSEQFNEDLRDTGMNDLFACYTRLEDVPAPA
ncbi:MAG: STAS domain-containing protein, partial [Chloroflexi bacterium]|nr:STAS domain-containing protein [Chloroflexota bacterium]